MIPSAVTGSRATRFQFGAASSLGVVILLALNAVGGCGGGPTEQSAGPTATITAPTPGRQFLQGGTIAFQGNASDPEDGSLSGTALQWTSNLDGAIGSGTSFSRNDLSVGAHTITLTAEDSDGKTDQDTRSFTVVPPPSPATSVVQVSQTTVASGLTVTLTLVTKAVDGTPTPIGGATVAFTKNGGTSDGTIGPVTDHGNGTYSATFTATTSGSARVIGATLNTAPVSTPLPSINVNPGPPSTLKSVVTVSAPSVASGGQVTLTLQAKDAVGNLLTAGGATVVFSQGGGISTGLISATTDHANGTYTATFTGQTAGTPTTIGARIGGNAVTTPSLPLVTVIPGAISSATSLVTVSAPTVVVSGTVTLTLLAKDLAGNSLTTGGAVVVFTQSGGTSVGQVGPTTDHGTGLYSATFTGEVAGTPTTIGATINAASVTSTPVPAVTVTPAPVVARTWTGAVSADWHTSGNWAPLGVPGTGDDVRIPGSGPAVYPVVNSSSAVMVRDLIVESGATLDMGQADLTVGGHVIVDGTLISSRLITLNGTGKTMRGSLPILDITGVGSPGTELEFAL